MYFRNRHDGSEVPLVVEPTKAIETLSEGLHKVLGAIWSIQLYMHKLAMNLHKGETGPHEATHVVHSLSHSLKDLCTIFIECSPIHAYNPETANRWIELQAREYVEIVLNPLLLKVQEEVDRVKAEEGVNDQEYNEINAKIAELEAKVARGEKPTMAQLLEALAGRPGSGPPPPSGPAPEIKDTSKDKPQPKRPSRRNPRN